MLLPRQTSLLCKAEPSPCTETCLFFPVPPSMDNEDVSTRGCGGDSGSMGEHGDLSEVLTPIFQINTHRWRFNDMIALFLIFPLPSAVSSNTRFSLQVSLCTA